MKEKSIKILFIKNLFLFIIFGVIISGSTVYFVYKNNYKNIENKIEDDSKILSNSIEFKVEHQLKNAQYTLNSISINNLFINYLINPSTDTEFIIKELFIALMNNNDNFFQLRFLDNKGMEKIRVDRSKTNIHNIFSIEKEYLQDKSKRYYFLETIKKDKDEFYYSDLDLNIENEQLEIPIRPTIRIAKKVYYKDNFLGILIINIEMDELLRDIRKNKIFDLYLVDKNNYFLVHPDSNKNWSRYFNREFTLEKELKEINNHIVEEHTYYISLEKYFKNNQNLQLILKLKENYYNELLHNNEYLMFIIAIILLILSFILAIIISFPTSKIYIEFNKLYKNSLKYLNIIDKYVMTIRLNSDGICLDVSQRFCEISEYSRNELIGKNVEFLLNNKHENYKDLLETVYKDLTWNGELENKTKNGKLYWINVTAIPEFYNEKVIGYTAVCRNITDRKLIEKISETDTLTQIYNRLKLDKELKIEFNRFSRYTQVFSVILIDIDYFKKVNDTYGHLIGDSVLIEVSNILRENIRNTDILGRWGGEEFLIICPETDINGSFSLSEKLRKEIENYEFNVVKYKTVSIGVTQIKNGDDIISLLKRVDENLYKSKQNGRNRVSSDF